MRKSATLKQAESIAKKARHKVLTDYPDALYIKEANVFLDKYGYAVNNKHMPDGARDSNRRMGHFLWKHQTKL